MSDSREIGRPEKYSAEELEKKALELQLAYPRKSEGAICGMLRVGREYLADRASKNPNLQEIREVMAAIRQDAWEELLDQMITNPEIGSANARAYEWGSRNVLGWRNGEALVEVKKEAIPGHLDKPKVVSPADYLEMLKARKAKEVKS